MKQLITLFVFLFFAGATEQVRGQQNTGNGKISMSCSELGKTDKPVFAVTNFKSKSVCAGPETGPGLSSMLINAMLESGCFRIVDREKMLEKLAEQGIDPASPGTESSLALISKQAGAQILLTGTITEFSEVGNDENLGDLVGSSSAFAVSSRIDTVRAHIALTIRLVNPQTGNLILFKSFEQHSKAVGAATGGLYELPLSELFFKSKAMEQAVQEIMLDMVSFISRQRIALLATAKEKPETKTLSNEPVKAEQCNSFKKGFKPIVIVVLPKDNPVNKKTESGPAAAARPNDTGVNTIREKFVKFGYKTLDQYALDNLRNNTEAVSALGNPGQIAALGKTYGADIVIAGETFTSFAKTQNKRASCHIRLELKVVESASGRILCVSTYHGDGLDNAESRSAQKALEAAAKTAGDDLLTRLCGLEIKQNTVKKTEAIAAQPALKNPAPEMVSKTPAQNNDAVTVTKDRTLPEKSKAVAPTTASSLRPQAASLMPAASHPAPEKTPQSIASAPAPKQNEAVKPVTASTAPQPNSIQAVQLLEIDVTNVNFTQKTQIQRFLEQYPGVKIVTGSYSYKNAHFIVQHNAAQQEIISALANGKTGLILEKTGEVEKSDAARKQYNFAAAR